MIYREGHNGGPWVALFLLSAQEEPMYYFELLNSMFPLQKNREVAVKMNPVSVSISDVSAKQVFLR